MRGLYSLSTIALHTGELDDDGVAFEDDDDDGKRMGLSPCLGLFGNFSKLSNFEESS